MATRVTMPQLGESVVEGTVGKWLVAEGQHIEKDQPLVEILTDKADSEIPAPVGGVVTSLLAAEDQTVAVGQDLCEIDETQSAASDATKPAAGSENPVRQSPAQTGGETPNKVRAAAAAGRDETPMATPAARKLAREQGLDLARLATNDPAGRYAKEDVQRAANGGAGSPRLPAAPASASSPNPHGRAASPATAVPPPAPTGAFKPPPYRPQPGDEIVPFSRRRRIIADHMVYSKHVAPEVVTLAECDLHRTARLREKHKSAFKKEGIGLNFLAFACAAVARALREHPELNARVLDNAYVKLRDIHLGIAVDTPDGLVVPVLRHADELTLRGLAKGIDDLARRAREGRLSPDDLAGKTFTVSNPGRQGNLVGGAIISQPNVGILRMGTIKKRVVVLEQDGEDLLAIHPTMHMALTYDHRIVDGVRANGFLFRVVELLEAGEFDL